MKNTRHWLLPLAAIAALALAGTLAVLLGQRPQATAVRPTAGQPASPTALPLRNALTPLPALGVRDRIELSEMVARASVIARGTVVGEEASRWDTPDGKAPPDPLSREPAHVIFTPTQFKVERYLKNPQATELLALFRLGGTVGEVNMLATDSLQLAASERAVLFLAGPFRRAGYPSDLWVVWDKYVVTTDGETISEFGGPVLPLKDLEDEIVSLAGLQK